MLSVCVWVCECVCVSVWVCVSVCVCVNVFVSVCECVNVCVCECVNVCVCVWMNVSVWVWVVCVSVWMCECECVCECVSVSVWVWMSVCECVSECVCVSVCVWACVYMCVWVCEYVCECVCVCVCVCVSECPQLQLLNHITEFHEIWYESYVIWQQQNAEVFNSVKSVITWWRRELVREGDIREMYVELLIWGHGRNVTNGDCVILLALGLTALPGEPLETGVWNFWQGDT